MNYRLLAKYLGTFLAVIGLTMLPSALWAVYFGEWVALFAFLTSMAVALLFAGAMYMWGRGASTVFYQREALLMVSGAWFAAGFLGALPFLFCGSLGMVDALFESVSGFTTTGASVMTDIESHPKSILFWRSFTHWLGGMGIVVLFLAVLPYLGAGGKQLFRSESPGPDPRGLRPRVKESASLLYKIYLALTALQTVLLMLTGKMDLYDALCHTFGTLATGGFSTRQASIAAYDSLAVETIIIFFMVLAGTNFALFFEMWRGRWKSLFRDTEWRAYLILLAAGTLLITFNLWGYHGPFVPPPGWSSAPENPVYSITEAFRVAAFQTVSIMTTTGYGTDNFDVWPPFSRVLLVTLMFFGGCAGSTAGGLKVVRIIMLVKMAAARIELTFRPKNVQAMRISGHVVEDDVQSMVYGFFVLYLGWFAAGSLFMAALGLPIVTAVTSVAATLNNIGPGLEFVGAAYHLVPTAGKLFLSLCMVMGRLEMFSICVLMAPSFWRSR